MYMSEVYLGCVTKKATYLKYAQVIPTQYYTCHCRDSTVGRHRPSIVPWLRDCRSENLHHEHKNLTEWGFLDLHIWNTSHTFLHCRPLTYIPESLECNCSSGGCETSFQSSFHTLKITKAWLRAMSQYAFFLLSDDIDRGHQSSSM